MANFWEDPEVNPHGLRNVSEEPLLPVTVLVTVTPLAYFKSEDGKLYLCTSFGDVKRRASFVATDKGFQEVGDQGIAFTIARMTDEIIAKKNQR